MDDGWHIMSISGNKELSIANLRVNRPYDSTVDDDTNIILIDKNSIIQRVYEINPMVFDSIFNYNVSQPEVNSDSNKQYADGDWSLVTNDSLLSPCKSYWVKLSHKDYSWTSLHTLKGPTLTYESLHNERMRFGQGLSLNANGTRLAVGAPSTANFREERGINYIYIYETETSLTTPVHTIKGPDTTCQFVQQTLSNEECGFGECVSLNKDGSILAVAHPEQRYVQIFVDDDSTETTYVYRQTLYSPTQDSNYDSNADFGGGIRQIQLNYDGNKIVLGVNNNDIGTAYVFETDDNWQTIKTIHSMIDTNNGQTVELNGSRVSMNGPGNRIAVGAPQFDYVYDTNDTNITNKDSNTVNEGRVRIFECNDSDEWVQLGDDLVVDRDTNSHQDMVACVSLNYLGDRVAISDLRQDADSNDSRGFVEVYEYSKLEGWNRLGERLEGDAQYDEFGSDVKLNSVGDRLFVSAVQDHTDITCGGAGYVKVYSYSDVGWQELAVDSNNKISGNTDYNETNSDFGQTISINEHGTLLAIGDPWLSENTLSQGCGKSNVTIWQQQES